MKRCACGNSLDDRRADCVACSGKCRMRALRERREPEAADPTRNPPQLSVTVRAPLVTPTEFVGGPCPAPNRCRHYMRFASGPWTCDYCHPRVTVTKTEADAPADDGRALRVLGGDLRGEAA
jgi:hypothetical protein